MECTCWACFCLVGADPAAKKTAFQLQCQEIELENIRDLLTALDKELQDEGYIMNLTMGVADYNHHDGNEGNVGSAAHFIKSVIAAAEDYQRSGGRLVQLLVPGSGSHLGTEQKGHTCALLAAATVRVVTKAGTDWVKDGPRLEERVLDHQHGLVRDCVKAGVRASGRLPERLQGWIDDRAAAIAAADKKKRPANLSFSYPPASLVPFLLERVSRDPRHNLRAVPEPFSYDSLGEICYKVILRHTRRSLDHANLPDNFCSCGKSTRHQCSRPGRPPRDLQFVVNTGDRLHEGSHFWVLLARASLKKVPIKGTVAARAGLSDGSATKENDDLDDDADSSSEEEVVPRASRGASRKRRRRDEEKSIFQSDSSTDEDRSDDQQPITNFFKMAVEDTSGAAAGSNSESTGRDSSVLDVKYIACPYYGTSV